MEAGPGLSRSHLNSAVELASNKAIFPAGVGLQRQAPVSPQLPLGPEAMRVWIKAINRAVRMGPIEGIWHSNLVALCFLLSANGSRAERSTHESYQASSFVAPAQEPPLHSRPTAAQRPSLAQSDRFLV